MDDKKLEDEIKEYKKIGQENKKVDVAALMMNALQRQNQNSLSPRLKKWGYLISIGLPPLGLLFALRFYFGDEDDAKTAAYICLGLTGIGLILLWLGAKLLLSSSGTSLQQLQQINVQDIQQLTQ